MDQIKVALAWLKQHHFWVLSGVASLSAVLCWYLASGQITAQIEDNRKKIDNEFKSMSQVRGKPFHPNAGVIERQAAEVREVASKVQQVWDRRYQRQRDRVLKWPAQLDIGISRPSDSFLRHVRDKQFGDFISDRFRERYLNYIEKRFPDLPKIIQALELDSGAPGGMPGMGGAMGMGGGMGMGMGMGAGGGFGADTGVAIGEDGKLIEEKDFLVNWRDQDTVRQQLAWNSNPSSLKIWVTQEDLWVYETVLTAIAQTNEAAGADRYSNAAVRDIYQLQVGSEAAKSVRTETRIYRPQGAAAGGGAAGGMMGADAMGGGDMGGGGMSMGGGDMMGGGGMGDSGESELQELLAGRYVDADEKPLPAPADGAPLNFGVEYKRLPVNLALRLDQRWLPRLVVQLAEAPLQIEVKEIRINPASGGGGGGGMRGGGGGGAS
ncbi:MAG: hypothetical protein AAF790_10665, partial [Planctomycetota bacterium]